jgi:OHCU decarboxylase
MESKLTVPQLLTKPKEDVMNVLGGIYEHSPWIAQQFYENFIQGKDPSEINISNVHDLHLAMASIVEKSSHAQKLELLRSHPDLCAKIEKLKTLTKESQEEQSRAGLGSLTEEEKASFTKMNDEYKEKFDFPFILAARNVTKHTVLAAIEGRLKSTWEAEFAGALVQVGKIAWMRLLAALDTSGNKGYLTCHVLDTAHGCPGKVIRHTYSFCFHTYHIPSLQ